MSLRGYRKYLNVKTLCMYDNKLYNYEIKFRYSN